MFLKCVECTECGWSADAKQLRTICESCGANVQARYELRAAREAVSRDQIVGRPFDMWRYREVLPVAADVEPVTLGEGGTPLLPANRLGSELGLTKLYVKDEGQNPTGSFKARGMSAAVSMAKTFGVEALAVPSAGNAASAAAAYGARATAWANVKRPDKALPDFDQIIRLRPNDANSYVVRGVTKANLGKPLAALADIEVALSLDPGNAKTHVVRGMIWQAVKQFAAARIAFESAVRADAASLKGHNKLALLLVTCSDASVRDYKRGIQHAQECCKLTDYKQWQHLAMLGTAYAQAGQFPEAIKWQQSAVDSAPAEAQAQGGAARRSHGAGRLDPQGRAQPYPQGDGGEEG